MINSHDLSEDSPLTKIIIYNKSSYPIDAVWNDINNFILNPVGQLFTVLVLKYYPVKLHIEFIYGYVKFTIRDYNDITHKPHVSEHIPNMMAVGANRPDWIGIDPRIHDISLKITRLSIAELKVAIDKLEPQLNKFIPESKFSKGELTDKTRSKLRSKRKRRNRTKK